MARSYFNTPPPKTNNGPTDNVNMRDTFEICVEKKDENSQVIETPDINKGEPVHTPLDYEGKLIENVDDNNQEIIEKIEPESSGDVIMENKNNANNVIVSFKNNTAQIQYIVLGTQTKDTMMAVNGKLTLIHGRGYLVPISNKELNSDNNLNIKIYSDLADKIDIKYVINGIAFVIPIQHNTEIKNKDIIAKLV